MACYVRNVCSWSEWSLLGVFLQWSRGFVSRSNYGCVSSLYSVGRTPYVKIIICPSVYDPLSAFLPKSGLFLFKFDIGNFYFDLLDSVDFFFILFHNIT
jgi:hypothetical protein